MQNDTDEKWEYAELSALISKYWFFLKKKFAKLTAALFGVYVGAITKPKVNMAMGFFLNNPLDYQYNNELKIYKLTNTVLIQEILNICSISIKVIANLWTHKLDCHIKNGFK